MTSHETACHLKSEKSQASHFERVREFQSKLLQCRVSEPHCAIRIVPFLCVTASKMNYGYDPYSGVITRREHLP